MREWAEGRREWEDKYQDCVGKLNLLVGYFKIVVADLIGVGGRF